MRLTVDQIVQATGGRMLTSHTMEFDSFGIDSRKVEKGSLFFALKGETTDGHLFLQDAAHRGAGGAVVERPAVAGTPLTLIQVQDSLGALHALASWVRRNSGSRFIGITGSAGKTSTKEFTAALLGQKYTVFKSEGNLNSITGMPLSLLAFHQEECGVFEVGMNQPGEISALSKILRPHIAVILNVSVVHLGQFSSIDAIADEKASLIRGMPEGCSVVYNADEPLIAKRIQAAGGNHISYGMSSEADLQLSSLQLRGVRGCSGVFRWKENRFEFETKLCGTGNLQNIAAAACTSLLLELSWEQILSGIRNLEPFRQRGTLIETDGVHIYDDSYNSNPKALEIVLKLIEKSDGYKRKVAVLGDMLELGPEEDRFHRAAGEQVASCGFDVLITAGTRRHHMAEAARKSGGPEVFETADSEEAATVAGRVVRKNDLVLIKGSRGMKMERVVEAVCILHF